MSGMPPVHTREKTPPTPPASPSIRLKHKAKQLLLEEGLELWADAVGALDGGEMAATLHYF